MNPGKLPFLTDWLKLSNKNRGHTQHNKLFIELKMNEKNNQMGCVSKIVISHISGVWMSVCVCVNML